MVNLHLLFLLLLSLTTITRTEGFQFRRHRVALLRSSSSSHYYYCLPTSTSSRCFQQQQQQQQRRVVVLSSAVAVTASSSTEEEDTSESNEPTSSSSITTITTTTTSSMTQDQPCCLLKDTTINELKGKCVLLTGASGGLGRCFALQLSCCELSTLILSARKQDALQKLAEECKSIMKNSNNNVQIHILTCDLSDPNSVTKLANDALRICPTIDVLINNGGVSSRSKFVDTSDQVDRQVMQINFMAGAALAKAFVPGMISSKSKSGRIIWISSVQGLVGIPNRSSYAASKFAVQGYCESIRAELATSGISVHTVSPGYIRTNLSKSAVQGDGTSYGKMDPTTAAGADPTDVAVEILDGCCSQNKLDFVVAATLSAKVAIWLRLLCPSLLRYMLVQRYEKSQQQLAAAAEQEPSSESDGGKPKDD